MIDGLPFVNDGISLNLKSSTNHQCGKAPVLAKGQIFKTLCEILQEFFFDLGVNVG